MLREAGVSALEPLRGADSVLWTQRGPGAGAPCSRPGSGMSPPCVGSLTNSTRSDSQTALFLRSLGRGACWRCFPTSPSGTSFAGGVSMVAAVATHTSPEGCSVPGLYRCSFSSHRSFARCRYYSSRSLGKETEAQRGLVTCSGSHSR